MKQDILQSNNNTKIQIPSPNIGSIVSINNTFGIYVGTEYQMQCACCQELNNKNPLVIRYTSNGIEERIVNSLKTNYSNQNQPLIATGLYQSRIVEKCDVKFNQYEKILKDAKLI
jgi:hypothetical protein